MESLAVLGGVAATVQILDLLIQASYRVSRLSRELRHICESTEALHHDLEAMQYALVVIDQSLRSRSTPPDLPNPVQLRRIISHAHATLERLETIFQDLIRHRTILPRLREFYRARDYDQDIRYLRTRITTHISVLSLPVLIASTR